MGLLSNQMIAGAAGAAGGGGITIYDYQISKSVRMNKVADNDGANFSKTFSGSPTSTKKGTFSIWVKRVSVPSNETHAILVTGAGGGSSEQDIKFENNKLRLSGYSPSMDLTTTQVFRDISTWYHIVVAWDTTQGTSTNRVKLYVNGEQITSFSASTYPSQDQVILWYSNTENRIGLQSWNDNNVYNGYMAETIGIDGTTYAASDFGETVNGVWVPKDASGLTFGNNGFYLNYASSGDLGNDVSGNNNDWTPNNLAPSDSMLDTPTFNSDSNGGNMCTWNPLDAKNMAAPTEGNLSVDFSGTNYNQIRGTMSIGNSGKWYMELYKSGTYASYPAWGICDQSQILTSSYTTPGYLAKAMAGIAWDFNASKVYKSLTYSESSSGTEIGATANVYTNTAQIVGMAIDLDNNKIFTHVNGTWDSGCGDPSSGGSGFDASGLSGVNNLVPVMLPSSYNSPNYVLVGGFGADSTFAGLTSAGSGTDVNGYGNFKYTVPTGYGAICQGNQSVADEVDPAQTEDNIPTKLFSATTYTGNGSASARNIDTGVASDWVWIKNRGASGRNMLYDSTRGVGKYLHSDTNAAEDTSGTSLSAFNSNGFQLSDDGTYLNAGSNTYVAYNWRSNGGTTSSGSGDLTSTHQVDPSGGFSIVKAVGDGGSGDKTVSHGLSAAPTAILAKNLDTTYNWDTFWAEGLTASTYGIRLNTSDNEFSGRWGTVNSSIFTCKDNYTWAGTNNYIYYCFTNIEGYIKAGTYVGNGNDDGTFSYTGFKPAWLLIREVAQDNWLLYNNKTLGYNLDSAGNAMVYPDTDNAEENQASRAIDILSNGFKLRTSNATGNASGGNYIYLAFASNPFKYSLAR